LFFYHGEYIFSTITNFLCRPTRGPQELWDPGKARFIERSSPISVRRCYRLLLSIVSSTGTSLIAGLLAGLLVSCVTDEQWHK